jgi:hypothetical protein
MSPTTRDVKKHVKARQRRHLKALERLERDRHQAQQAAEALEQALHDLGLPKDLVVEIEGRLRSQKKLLGKILGVMCPPLFGCRTNSELCRVRGWDKNLPARLLGALPKRSWIKRLRRLGIEVLVPLWRYAANASAATRSRWQWTWVGDDSVFKKYHIPSHLVVACVPVYRKPPEVRIWRLRNQSRVGTVPPSTSTPHCPACWARRW